MNALVAKEIRLLKPAYVLALLLAAFPWMLSVLDLERHDAAPPLAEGGLLIGVTVLALSSLGREFSLNTFGLMLAQPSERRRIWWTKVGVLAAAVGTVYALFAFWCFCSANFGVSGMAGRTYPKWQEVVKGWGIVVVVIATSGLWTTMLVRTVAGAFWLTVLVPFSIFLLLDEPPGAGVANLVFMLYAAAGFFWTRRQFLGAEETGWTGGVVTLGGFGSSAIGTSRRNYRPWAALFWKELKLHQIGLVGMAGLFLVHLCVVVARKAGHETMSQTMRSGLEIFWGIWLVAPLLAGNPAAAEERKLGTMEAHLCLPVSSRVQFWMKLFCVVVLGGFLSAVLLWTAEGIATAVGATAGFSVLNNAFSVPSLVDLSVIFGLLALAGFYASTLTRNIVQMLATAAGTAMGIFLLGQLAQARATFWRGSPLGLWIGAPVVLGTILWLAYGNFRCAVENWPLWRRNIQRLSMAIVFSIIIVTATYERVWEYLTPLETAHGAARISNPAAAKLTSYGPYLLAALPQGGLWLDRIRGNDGSDLRESAILGDLRFGPGKPFIDAAKWTQTALTHVGMVGIREGGSLWIAERTADTDRPVVTEVFAPFRQFGSETNWKSVVGEHSHSMVLLKGDGTLWRLGTNDFDQRKAPWQGFHATQPNRLGTDTDWAKILRGGNYIYAWKRDGKAWTLHPPTSTDDHPVNLASGTVAERAPAFDHSEWKTITRYANDEIGLRADGTLWICRKFDYPKSPRNIFRQIGSGTSWVALAGGYGNILAAIAADGSLWHWKGTYNDIDSPPLRFGGQNDWIGAWTMEGGFVCLAADGSLWYWWDRTWGIEYSSAWFALPRKPARLGNIFGNG